jgi:starch synthase
VKVVQVCIGRFHHFDLAKQLDKRGLLEQFYTGYPSFKLQDEHLPKGKITTFPWLMTPRMVLSKYPLLPSWTEQILHRWVQETLDSYVAANLPECDVVLALSGSGLRAGKLAQQRGGYFICDRGSSHIRYQDEILHEEFQRWGDSFEGVDPKVIAKEELEYEFADLITVPSEFAYRSFVEMGIPEEKLRKVPYGVDLQKFKKVAEPTNRYFDVLFVGQVGFRKGVPDLLNAFERFQHPNKRLRIVGGIQPEMIRFFEKHPPAANVQLLGHMSQSRLNDIMSQSHVMVLPSIEEGLALVQAQAMSCGCPVIGTVATGAEDLFTDGIEGFIVAPRDSQAIADRLQWLADNPDERMSMSEASLCKVQTMDGWNQYGNIMETVLRDLLEQSNARQSAS